MPRIASKPIIVGSSKFRSKGRFPVLSYYHQSKEVGSCSDLISGVQVLCRSRCPKEYPSLHLEVTVSVADREVLTFPLIMFLKF